MPIRFSSSRVPKPGELKRLYRHASWARDRKTAGIARMIANTQLFFTAWDGPRLVGMARTTTDFSYRAVLWDVIVDPPHSGLGIGSALVKAFLAHPRLRSVESFWLFTTDKQAFYKKLGFKLQPEHMMVLRRTPR